MVLPIFRNSVKLIGVKPDNSSELSQKKQVEDVIRLNFRLVTLVDFRIGDYIVSPITNQKYTLLKLPKITEAPKNNKYECMFEGVIHEFGNVRVFLATRKTDGGYYRDYKFPLTGNAQTFLQFIVDNLNRNGGTYQVGTAKETGTLLIDFNNWSVTQAIFKLSTKLEFDWYLDGDTLNFDAPNNTTAYSFQVGRLSGFTELTRTQIESELVETVVYGYGSSENMPPRNAEEGQTYDSPLLTENRLAFSGVDGESKLEKNTGVYGRRESVQEFDNIKPEFTGGVTGIDAGDRKVFYDTSIDFNINEQLLAGVFPKITFLTGRLIGLTFNISYDHTTKKITMDLYTDESGTYPNDTIYAEVGNAYKIFDIVMPDVRVAEAAQRLQEATQEYIDKSSAPMVVYTAKVDKQYIEANGITLKLGDVIRIVSSGFVVDALFEIKEIKRKVNNPNIYEIKFGDTLPKGLLATLKITNFTTTQEIYNIDKNSVTNNKVTNVIGDTTTWLVL